MIRSYEAESPINKISKDETRKKKINHIKWSKKRGWK
jgi:hypothetical protein